MLLIQHDDAGRNARPVEEVGRQADDALDGASAHQLAADVGLHVAPEEDAVGHHDRGLARALERFEDVQEISVIAVALGRDQDRLAKGEALIEIVFGIEARAPRLIGEGRIGDHEIEGLELVIFRPLRIGQGVAVPDIAGGHRVEDHVHLGQGGGHVVDLLPEDRDAARGDGGGLEQQRAGAAGGIVQRLILALGVADADDLRDHAGDLGGREELPLALARLHREVAHQVLVGVAQEVIILGAVGAEIKGGVLEDGDEIGEAIHHLLALAQQVGVVEIGDVDHTLELRVGVGQPADDLLIELIADLLIALERHHIVEAGAFGHLDGRERLPRVLIGDVLDEEHREHKVLVLRGIHPAAQRVAARPEGGIEFRFFDWHNLMGILSAS